MKQTFHRFQILLACSSCEDSMSQHVAQNYTEADMIYLIKQISMAQHQRYESDEKPSEKFPGALSFFHFCVLWLNSPEPFSPLWWSCSAFVTAAGSTLRHSRWGLHQRQERCLSGRHSKWHFPPKWTRRQTSMLELFLQIQAPRMVETSQSPRALETTTLI